MFYGRSIVTCLQRCCILCAFGHLYRSFNIVTPRRFALTLLAFIVDIAFALSLGGLLGMHARMVWLNVTTIEMFEKQRVTQWPFDRGPRRNFQEVFGSRCIQALTPRLSACCLLQYRPFLTGRHPGRRTCTCCPLPTSSLFSLSNAKSSVESLSWACEYSRRANTTCTPSMWCILDHSLKQVITKALRSATHRWLNFSYQRMLSQVLWCSAWRWWLPTHTKQERERMLQAALAAEPFEEAMGTEFATL